MCTSPTLTRWQRRCLELLAEVEGVTLAAALVDARPRPPRRRGLADLRDERALWRVYDARWVGRRSRAVERVDCTDLLADVPQIDLHVETRGKFSEHVPSDEIAAVRQLDLDFLLRFAFGILRGEILD